MNKVNSRTNQLVLILVLSLLLPGAAAQGWLAGAQATGSIQGSFDGSERSWQTFELEAPDGVQSTATYLVMMDTLYSFSLQAHSDGKLVEGAVAISFAKFDGPFADCPCVLTGDITYWTTSSMFGEVFIGESATITVLEAELLPDGAYSLTGTAEAELFFYEDVFVPEASGDPVSISLEFSIDRVTLEELDLD